MTGDREEGNRVLGFTLPARPRARRDDERHAPPDAEQHVSPAEEPQRVLGFPVDWFDELRRRMRRRPDAD